MNIEEKIGAASEKAEIKAGAEEAADMEREAIAEKDIHNYTHHFKKPFTFRDITVEELTFNWGTLTGNDHLEIENEMLMRGKTLVVPEFTGDFLCGMAVRACTMRDENGVSILDMVAMRKMPMRDFQIICKKARAFLQRAGS